MMARWQARRSIASSLFHGPNYFLPEMVDRGIITVHDLSVFRYSETHPAERIRQFEKDFARSIARALHILTDSETIRQEVIAFAGVSPDKVTAVPLGVSSDYRRRGEEETNEVLSAWGLTHGSYSLCVSTFEPRKKIGELIHAWRNLSPKVRRSNLLVLAGAKGWGNDALMDDIKRAQSEGWLRLIGYVDEMALPYLYAGAGLFLYPSAYEGFGLPPIEAMASGVPTIISDRSCLPEVTKGAAMLIDPDDGEGFTNAIERGLMDMRWRDNAVKQGVSVAAGYSWNACLHRTRDIYEKIWLM